MNEGGSRLAQTQERRQEQQIQANDDNDCGLTMPYARVYQNRSYNDGDDADEAIIVIVLILSLFIALTCCMFCPGEVLIGVGVLKFFFALTFAVGGASPGTLIGGIIGAAIWIGVGSWKIEYRERRRQQQQEEDEAVNRAFSRRQDEEVPLASDAESLSKADPVTEKALKKNDGASTSQDLVREALRPRQGPMAMLLEERHHDCSDTHEESDDGSHHEQGDGHTVEEGVQMVDNFPDDETDPDDCHDATMV